MNATLPLTTNKPARRGFLHAVCIKCANPDAALLVFLHDTAQFKCDECGEEFSADDVREHLAAWQRVLDWCESAPTVGG